MHALIEIIDNGGNDYDDDYNESSLYDWYDIIWWQWLR